MKYTPRLFFCPRFSLRSLLLGVSLSAALFGWLASIAIKARHDARIVKQIEAAGASVDYGEYRFAGARVPYRYMPDWLTSLAGEAAFAHVEGIEFFGTLKDGANLAGIDKLPELWHLSFTDTEISDKHVVEIAKCSTVRRIDTFYADFSSQGVKLLAALPLQILSLDGDQVSDEWLRTVCGVPTLESLSVRSSQITASGFDRIVLLQRLKTLQLCYCEGVTDAAIAHLRNFDSLDELELKQLPVSDISCEHIATCSALRSLSLDECAVTDAGISEIARLGNLEELGLSGSQVGDHGIAQLSSLRKLQKLGIVRTTCSPAVIETLRSFKSLRHLALGPGIKKEAVLSLKESLPQCMINLFDDHGGLIMTLE